MERYTLNMGGEMLVKKSFYFARHGETDHNRQNICAGGMVDCPLNETGKMQALVLKAKLSDIKIDQVVSSSMQRAMQTAEIAHSEFYSIEPEIREWDLGDLEEKPVSLLLQHVENLPGHLPLPGGESKDDLKQRVIAAVNKALISCEGDVLFVSHGGVYWALLDVIKDPCIEHIGNAELVHFQAINDGWKIVKL